MPVQNYGAIMQGAADLTAMPANAFAQGQARRQAQDYRNSLLGMDQQRLSMDQQKFDADQAATAQGQQTQASVMDLIDQAETAFEQGGYEAVRPIVGRLAAYDPRIAEQIAKSYEEDEKQPYSLQTQQGPFGSQIIHDGQRFQVVEPPKPTTPNQIEAPADQRLYQWYANLPPEQQQAFLQMKRANATPEIAGATTAAQEQAKANVEQAKTARANETAFNVYTAGMKGVTAALAKTSTGPIVGRAPAYTAGQQSADGAIAAMAPVLKQMFRAAGEGTFTDKDQALLIEMLPTRADRKEALDYKIANIDNIVRAKLGQSPQAVPEVGDADLPTYSPAQAAMLPPGTAFKGNDGKRRVKK
jgi:uncharacterized protein (UPF0297 family)